MHISKTFISSCIATLLLNAPNTHAIVSMESVHFGKPAEGYSGAFDINASGEFGNTDKQTVSSGFKIVRQRDTTTNFVLVNYQYGESGGVRDKNNAFIHLRHIQQLNEQHAWEAYGQVSRDEFTRLTLRTLLGAGARLNLWHNTNEGEGYLGLGAFYETEHLDLGSNASESDRQETWRGNAYLVLKTKFNEHVSFVSTTYYQPSLADTGNYRAIENASLVSKLSDSLATKLSLNITHNSEPAANVEKTDTTITVGLDYSF